MVLGAQKDSYKIASEFFHYLSNLLDKVVSVDKASTHKNPHHLYALQMFNAFLWTSSPLDLLVLRALWETDIAKIVSILLKTPGLLFSNNFKVGYWL